MGLDFKKEVVSSGVAVWSTVHETAIGGFTLDTTGLVADSILPAGTPVGYDESTRIAKIVKSGVLFADATTIDVNYKVKKKAGFVVGEFFAFKVGGNSQPITAIDTANADYDIITVPSTLGTAQTAGTAVFQSKAAGPTAGAYVVTPKGLLYEETTVGKNVSLSVVVRGTLYARRAPINDASIQAALPLIIFSQSY